MHENIFPTENGMYSFNILFTGSHKKVQIPYKLSVEMSENLLLIVSHVLNFSALCSAYIICRQYIKLSKSSRIHCFLNYILAGKTFSIN